VQIGLLGTYFILPVENYASSNSPSSVFAPFLPAEYETQFSAMSPHFVPAPGYVPVTTSATRTLKTEFLIMADTREVRTQQEVGCNEA